jgi:hypothetical protein
MIDKWDEMIERFAKATVERTHNILNNIFFEYPNEYGAARTTLRQAIAALEAELAAVMQERDVLKKENWAMKDDQETYEEQDYKIAELEQIVDERWTSMTERLPEHDIRVLLLANNEQLVGKLDWISPSSGAHFIILETGGGKIFYTTNATHWMPLPQPPQAQS